MDSYSVAVDIGGTFTDCVVVAGNGRRSIAKAATVALDPSEGVIAAIATAAQGLGLDLHGLLRETSSFVHGSTIATNAMVQRVGSRTGLITTRGHEDSLIVGRVVQKVAGLSEREKTHVVHLKKAEPPLVAWSDIRGVNERTDSKGREVVPIDSEEVARAVDDLVGNGIESLAICFLFSFTDPSHEQLAKRVVRERHPDLYLSVSSEVSPLLGEYERCVSTALNSYVGPVVSRYLEKLESRLRDLDYRRPLLVMQSNGGVTTVQGARERPLLTLDSGPSAGILGSRYFGRRHDLENLICTDVGGTTFDVGLVFAGELQLDPSPVIAQYSYSAPKVLVKSIGAGGGSIAWMDRAGGLRVGPRSAGADPGPACYGRGGTAPTVTDADVVLGYVNPDHFLGGSFKLDPGAAHDAIARLAAELGLDPIEVASGIFEIANAQMADLVRKSTVERGFDPRDFAILAYGGAGPVRAAFFGSDIGSDAIFVPSDSSVFSAFGILTADFTMTAEKTELMRTPLTAHNVEKANELYLRLEQQVREQYLQSNVDVSTIAIDRAVDIRFWMQANTLSVPVPSGSLSPADLAQLTKTFAGKYEATYGEGSAYANAGFELLNFRVTGTVRTDPLPAAPTGERTSEPATPDRQRSAYFASLGGYVATDCYLGTSLRPGQEIAGPAIIERMGDSIVVPPSHLAEMDGYGNFILTRRP